MKHRFVARGGERLDKLLAALLPDLSRARLQALISLGHVLVAGKPAKASMRPAAGAELSVEVPAAQPIELLAEDLALPVLFEDAHLLVIDKPAGMVVHPGAGVTRGTVVHGLLHQVRDLAGISGEMRPGIVHRLDKDTSGCLVVAKTEAALRGLQAQFKSRTVEKSYRALVHGEPPDAGELDTLFGRHPVHRKRFSSRVQKGRRAVTRFRVLARAPGAAWLTVELLTGRTHQIRAHFADAGWPIFGDALYGRREKKPVILRQALHAFRLAFSHPATGARMACEAPLPADLRAALRLLGLSSAG